MEGFMKKDADFFAGIINQISEEALSVVTGLDSRAAAVTPPLLSKHTLPEKGVGTIAALETFKTKYAPYLSGSAGPRYLGFVTGGATPAAIAGDWLVSIYDQNVVVPDDSVAVQLELHTIEMLKDLFSLPPAFSGAFVSGATMANFVGLALGRQWIGHQHGINISQQGLCGISPIKIVGGAMHSSIYKAASMVGIGRDHVHEVPCLEERESIDIGELKRYLENNNKQPCIVVANAGTVNSVDFDQIAEIHKLKETYPFWLHVDAAFGGFAACSPEYKHLLEGMEYADSITIDAHKWLNVPYDSAMQFTRHRDLQIEVFQNNAAYLGSAILQPEFGHMTPENSRRFRALPAWFTLMAYGKEGYRALVEKNIKHAHLLSEKLKSSTEFLLVAPTRLNVVCFTINQNHLTLNTVKKYLQLVKEDGRVFLTPTVYNGRPAIRAAFSNWRTTEDDVDVILNCLIHTLKHFKVKNP